MWIRTNDQAVLWKGGADVFAMTRSLCLSHRGFRGLLGRGEGTVGDWGHGTQALWHGLTPRFGRICKKKKER